MMPSGIYMLAFVWGVYGMCIFAIDKNMPWAYTMVVVNAVNFMAYLHLRKRERRLDR